MVHGLNAPTVTHHLAASIQRHRHLRRLTLCVTLPLPLEEWIALLEAAATALIRPTERPRGTVVHARVAVRWAPKAVIHQQHHHTNNNNITPTTTSAILETEDRARALGGAVARLATAVSRLELSLPGLRLDDGNLPLLLPDAVVREVSDLTLDLRDNPGVTVDGLSTLLHRIVAVGGDGCQRLSLHAGLPWPLAGRRRGEEGRRWRQLDDDSAAVVRLDVVWEDPTTTLLSIDTGRILSRFLRDRLVRAVDTLELSLATFKTCDQFVVDEVMRVLLPPIDGDDAITAPCRLRNCSIHLSGELFVCVCGCWHTTQLALAKRGLALPEDGRRPRRGTGIHHHLPAPVGEECPRRPEG